MVGGYQERFYWKGFFWEGFFTKAGCIVYCTKFSRVYLLYSIVAETRPISYDILRSTICVAQGRFRWFLYTFY